MKIFKTLSLAAAALVVLACGNNAQKAKEAAEREKAIADSIAQAEIAAKEASSSFEAPPQATSKARMPRMPSFFSSLFLISA